MRLIRKEERPCSGTAEEKWCGRTAALFSTFLLCSCATAPTMVPEVSRPVSLHDNAPAGSSPSPATAEESRQTRHGTLLSSWTQGSCTFERNSNSLSYYNIFTGVCSSLHLDVKCDDATALLCSDNFTVLIAPEKVVVAIGAVDILERREVLGIISGRFVPANSYVVSTKCIISEDGGIISQYLSGNTLEIISRSGNRWTLDLSDPYAGWSIGEKRMGGIY